jgi:S1-C subfamily serine protease
MSTSPSTPTTIAPTEEMRAVASFREVRDTTYSIETFSGSPAEIEQAVVPIVKLTISGEPVVIGSGFFIAHNLIATAAHVARDCLDRAGNLTGETILALQLLPDKTAVSRRAWEIGGVNRTDVAVLALMPPKKTDAPLTNVVAPISTVMPRVGDPVFTCAHPKTHIVSQTQIAFKAAFYKGEITKLYPHGRDASLMPGPCYETSMVIHGGASGAPVFDRRGLVIGINSTGFDETDVSFVSTVHPLFDIRVSEFVKGKKLQISIRELAARGSVIAVDDDGSRATPESFWSEVWPNTEISRLIK